MTDIPHISTSKSRQILILTDHLDARTWVSQAVKSPSHLDQWHVLTFGISKDVYQLENSGHLKKLARIEFLNTKDFSENCQKKVRDFFPSLVFSLSSQKLHNGKSLLNLFRMSDVNLWWFLEFTEKSAFRTPLINRLYYIALCQELLRLRHFDEIWLSLKDDSLAETIRENLKSQTRIKVVASPFFSKMTFECVRLILKRLFFINFMLAGLTEILNVHFRRLIMKAFGMDGSRERKNEALAIFSVYPVWWSKPFTSEASEWFFGSSHYRLSQSMPVIFVVWNMLSPFQVFKMKRYLKEVFCNKKIIPLEVFLSLCDTLCVFSLKLIRIAAEFKYLYSPKIQASFLKYDISNLVRQELQHSISKQTLFQSLLIHRAFKNFHRKFKCNALLFRNEFQPFERAALYSASKTFRTIGFQHSSIGRNHLPYFFADGEIHSYQSDAFHEKGPDAMPIPDHFLLSGLQPAEVWKQNGFKEAGISVCGPARFPKLINLCQTRIDKDDLRRRLNLPADTKIFFIALTITWIEVLNLLSLLPEALDDKIVKNSYFLFKCHPSARFEKGIAAFLEKHQINLRYQFLNMDVQLNDYISASDSLISSGSTISLEAIASRVMPVIINDLSLFSVNPMLEFKDACLFVDGAEDLRNALHMITQNHASLNAIRSHWPETLRRAFYRTDQDPVSNLVQVIENLVNR